MSPFLLVFADGTIFYIGHFLLVLALLLRLKSLGRWVSSILVLVALLGVIFVLISSTPLPNWLYAVWLTFVLFALVVKAHLLKRLSVALIALVSIFMVSFEFRYFHVPTVSVSKDTVIYVIGDSISEGMGARYTYWPDLLAGMTGCQVINLAKAGSTVRTGIEQAKSIHEPRSLVILEIGGNDLLGDTDVDKFRSDLNTLVSSLVDDHELLLMELLLYPFKNEYGAAQREIAERYSVKLIPKRIFADVFGTPGATSDGLHLSQIGHDSMAEIFSEIIEVE